MTGEQRNRKRSKTHSQNVKTDYKSDSNSDCDSSAATSVLAVSKAQERNFSEMSPLANVINPEAQNLIFESGCGKAATLVSFQYAGHHTKIQNSTLIEIQQPTESA